MGLMEGLSDWLRQIIAVILLAALIDLLLPNRTMQRYVRLVAGLFILLTLATPIMNWIKGDFTSELAAGLQSVEQNPQGAGDQLAMIEEAGARLRDKHQMQAAELVSSRLEASIRNEVEQSEQREVRSVDVQLEHGKDGALNVAKVVVLLEPEEAVPSRTSLSSPVREVDPIAAVDVQVDVKVWSDESQASEATEGEADRAAMAKEQEQTEEQVDRDTRLRISAMIASRFGVAVRLVEVKLPSAVAESGNGS
ncbi:stage III sporulation protein AF [Cohnella cholangitidis]|uniref:Stage III sporulation protein AF n=1 Tax=Cohnella cholangitidis TaxID=2598458 RepID=A0A7G5C4W1_9BACL|nr:stage III sporulation protein AF [Cohnella cholangitidis]QMV44245.1 stage III sporulation protein AF [Cohnella cholangitidis]